MNFTLDITHTPFSLAATVKTHGWFQLAPFHWDNAAQTLHWAMQTDEQPPFVVTIREGEQLKPVGARLDLQISRSDAAVHKVITDKVKHVFNLDLDLREFYRISEHYPILNRVQGKGMGRLMRTESVYEDVFKSICGTNVQWKQAVTMINNIARLGSPAPGTELRIFPGPQQVLQAGEQFLKDIGRVGYRSSYLIALCEHFTKPDPLQTPVENGELSYPELNKYFLGFKGIGQVTARYLCALYGRFDELAVDSLVIFYMTKTHFNGVRPEVKQIEDFYAEFGRWKYLAYWMEFILNEGWNPDA